MDKLKFSTSGFIFVLNESNKYDVFKRHYVLGFTQSWKKDVEIPEKLIDGLIKKPHSGYFIEEIEKLVR